MLKKLKRLRDEKQKCINTLAEASESLKNAIIKKDLKGAAWAHAIMQGGFLGPRGSKGLRTQCTKGSNSCGKRN